MDEFFKLLEESADNQNMPKAKAQPKPQDAPRSSNAERRENKKRFDAIERKLEKVKGEPERLKAELATIDPTDYEALLAKQDEIAAAEALIDELESEWLELSDLV